MAYETETTVSGSRGAREPTGLSDDTLGTGGLSDDTVGGHTLGGTESRGTRAAGDVARKASRKIDQARESAAGGLGTAADAVHSGAARVAGAAHRAGDAIASASEYVRGHDTGDMIDDLKDVVRSNPGAALLGAAALGFIVGRVLSRG